MALSVATDARGLPENQPEFRPEQNQPNGPVEPNGYQAGGFPEPQMNPNQFNPMNEYGPQQNQFGPNQPPMGLQQPQFEQNPQEFGGAPQEFGPQQDQYGPQGAQDQFRPQQGFAPQPQANFNRGYGAPSQMSYGNNGFNQGYNPNQMRSSPSNSPMDQYRQPNQMMNSPSAYPQSMSGKLVSAGGSLGNNPNSYNNGYTGRYQTGYGENSASGANMGQTDPQASSSGSFYKK